MILTAVIGFGLGAYLMPAQAATFVTGGPLTLVKDGASKAAIWFSEGEAQATGRTKPASDRDAAEDLASYVKQMSGATLELKTVEKDGKPAADVPAVIVGKLAVEMGMEAPPATLSGDGYRIQRKGNQLFLAGETFASTFFATAHLLETFGCRWFIDNNIGTVVPELKTLEVGELNIAQTPSFSSRSIWGPNWGGNAHWTKHNRLGGIGLGSSHNWNRWFCTTDPKDRAEYLSNVIARVQGGGAVSASISPPDGVNYCKCDRCKALDVPGYLEPSSGTPVISDRYQEFYNYIGTEVKKVNPKAILCHYAYADYTLPPKRVKDGPDNLCVFLAPIRFCRVHSLANTNCPPRQRCRQMVQDWAKVESKMGWREYNYNLAEMTVPMSKISIWKDDIPFLKEQGCIGLNIECLYAPHIYGPHTYLVARLAWDANADVDAIMDDFYTTFCGPAAAFVKSYWSRIDKAYRETPVHAGSFHGIHAFWTPELIKGCQADLEAAAKAVPADSLYAKRVAMFRMGLDNAKYYSDWREAVNRCDFEASQAIYDKWIAHMDAIHAAKIHPVGEYKRGYAPRFLGKGQDSGLLRVTGGRKRVMQLPDEWDFRYDVDGMGESNGWHKAVPGGAEWKKVKTYTATLTEQGIPEQLTWMWYRTTIRTPKTLPEGPLTLWFMEPDGNQIKVWLNGEPAGEVADIKSRQPYDLDLTGKLKADTDYVVTVKLWHRRISELMLGGFLRPIMIYAGGIPVPPPPPPAPAAGKKGK
jgi:hypothetical protein